MSRSRPHGRGRLAAAVVVSLSVHALIGAGWLLGPPVGSIPGSSTGDAVDAPADEVTTVVIRTVRPEPSQPLPPLPTPPDLPPAPPMLPPSVTVNAVPGPGAIIPVRASPPVPDHLPKPGGSRAIHGKKSGKTVVYLLDRSASMGPDGLLRRAVAAVRASLAELGPDTRFQIVAYNGGTTAMATRPVSPSPAAIDRATDWLGTLTAEGRSNHVAGFREALAMGPDEVYLLTDADDLEWSDVRTVEGLIRSPVRVSVAVFGQVQRAARTPLEGLTERTGGRVEYGMK